MSTPRVSVIIPTYNRERLVGRAIESVLGQTYDDFEVIVVDDASSDGTEAILRVYDDPRLRYLRHETNRGGGAARNTGIAVTGGRCTAVLDDDGSRHATRLAD